MSEPRVEIDDTERLVELARQGDREAFGALVGIYQHEVYTLALRLTADRDLAADVTQESFIRAWQAIGGFRGDAAFSTWLHRITVNSAWTLRKRRRRHDTQPLSQATEIPETSDLLAPEKVGEAAELRETLKRALAEIPTTQRAVVVLKDVYGWSHAEIAEALGISVTAAKVRLHRGHARLRALLENTRDRT